MAKKSLAQFRALYKKAKTPKIKVSKSKFKMPKFKK